MMGIYFKSESTAHFHKCNVHRLEMISYLRIHPHETWLGDDYTLPSGRLGALAGNVLPTSPCEIILRQHTVQVLAQWMV